MLAQKGILRGLLDPVAGLGLDDPPLLLVRGRVPLFLERFQGIGQLDRDASAVLDRKLTLAYQEKAREEKQRVDE